MMMSPNPSLGYTENLYSLVKRGGPASGPKGPLFKVLPVQYFKTP